MTKAELIKVLEQFPDDMPILVYDDERTMYFPPREGLDDSNIKEVADFETPYYSETIDASYAEYLITQRSGKIIKKYKAFIL
jgi:hypothetical protein